MKGVKDKVAIVTGASRGIGYAIAREFAEAGMRVVLVATKQETCDRVADALKTEFNTDTLGVACDVSDFDAVQGMVKTVSEKFGQIDVLVNNAGITRDKLLLRMTSEDWQDVLNVNLNSVFNCTKAVTRPMLKQKAGRIINISSVVGVMGNAGQANYAATKAGVIGFSKSVAKELGSKGILCNVIAPGFIATDMTDELGSDYLDGIVSQLPLKRLGSVQDIAGSALFLASDYSGYITGKVLTVDGGMHM